MRHITKTRALSLAAASLFVLPAAAQDSPPPATPPLSGAAAQVQSTLSQSFDRLFMLRDAQGNTTEVLSGQLALQKSRNPQVREVAQTLIEGHGMSAAELLPLLERKGLQRPRNIGTANAATYDALAKMNGTQFDRGFMAAQSELHENTIALYQQELALGTDADARAYATKYLPHILAHTGLIYQVAGAVQAPGSAERMAALNVDMAQLNVIGQQARADIRAMMASMKSGGTMSMSGMSGGTSSASTNTTGGMQ